MSRLPPIYTLTATRFPYTTLFRSYRVGSHAREGRPDRCKPLRCFRACRGQALDDPRRMKFLSFGKQVRQEGDTRDGADNTCEIEDDADARARSEEHTSELQSLMRISYAVFCLKKKNTQTTKLLPKTIHINLTH